MEKHLYEVVITMFVMAEDETDAAFVAAKGIDPGNTAEFEVDLATTAPHYIWDSIPHGSDDDRTVGSIIAENKRIA